MMVFLRSLSPLPLVLALLISGFGWPVGAAAQRRSPEVEIGIVTTAFAKIDILSEELEVLSGGRTAVDAGARLGQVVRQDLEYSGFFRVGLGQSAPDSLEFEYAIEGSVEGSLHRGQEQREARYTVNLKLLTYPERELVFSKAYNPNGAQLRASGHHFANQVIEMRSSRVENGSRFLVL